MADEAYCSVEILRSAQYEIEDIARMYVIRTLIRINQSPKL